MELMCGGEAGADVLHIELGSVGDVAAAMMPSFLPSVVVSALSSVLSALCSGWLCCGLTLWCCCARRAAYVHMATKAQ